MTVKDRLLQILADSSGRELSGQELADRLGVSRTAVWKAMNGLEAEGYEIEAGRNRGYRLVKEGDFLSAEGIKALLPEEMQEAEIIVLKSVNSTNTLAKKMAADGAKNGTAVIAEEQTAGRGRRGNTFFSPMKTGLYMTVILRPEYYKAETEIFTVCAGCAVCRAIESLTDKKPLIKWVNDIYLQNRKICGILSEATLDFESGQVDSVVVGIGINLTTEDFPDGLEKIAGSLMAGGVTRARLAAAVLKELKSCLDRSPDENIADYKAHSLVLGREVTFSRNGRQYTATAKDIDKKGRLEVITDEGELALDSGEISIRL